MTRETRRENKAELAHLWAVLQAQEANQVKRQNAPWKTDSWRLRCYRQCCTTAKVGTARRATINKEAESQAPPRRNSKGNQLRIGGIQEKGGLKIERAVTLVML